MLLLIFLVTSHMDNFILGEVIYLSFYLVSMVIIYKKYARDLIVKILKR